MQIGRSEPLQNPDGTQYFESPLFKQHSDYAHNHDIHIASSGLFPGNGFWALLRLIDREGRWQYRKEPFNTWRRSIEILLKEICILNDGAEGNNSASFRFGSLRAGNLLALVTFLKGRFLIGRVQVRSIRNTSD
ncbi:hypothetical protein AJ87_03085 [Rhizobium yanglingense]|nr:hypothetical protein AJ87_03085 [Rhizobium yanglingense]